MMYAVNCNTYLMLWAEYKTGMGQAELTFIKFNATARNVRILAQFDSWIWIDN